MKCAFQLGKFKVNYHSNTSEGDLEGTLDLVMQGQGGYPKAHLKLHWDEADLKVWPSAKGQDWTVPQYPNVGDLDAILTKAGFPSLTDVEDHVHEKLPGDLPPANESLDDDLELVGAAEHGDLDRVVKLLQAGACPSFGKSRALRYAAEGGHLPVVKLLLQHGAPIDGAHEVSTALDFAMAHNHYDVARYLVQQGADISKLKTTELALLNLTNQDLKGAAKKLLASEDLEVDPTKLWRYANNGNLAAVKAALAAGAARDDLDLALRYNGHLPVVQLLLQHGAAVHAGDDAALRWAACNGHLPVVQLLLQHGADVHAHDDEALRNAAANGHLPVVRLLLQHGADVHARDDAALRNAAYNGHLPVVKLLLQHGADISKLSAAQLRELNLSNQDLKDAAKKAFQGESTEELAKKLTYACQLPDLDAAATAIAMGADVNGINGEGTPIRWAIWNGARDLVKLLLDNGAVIPHDPNNGVFYLATRNKTVAPEARKEVAKLLIQHGADITKADKESLSRLDFTNQELKAIAKGVFRGESNLTDDVEFASMAEIGDLAGVRAALDAGQDPDVLKGRALRWSAATGQLDVVQLLLARGANPNTKFVYGTALEQAVSGEYLEVAKLLIRHGADISVLSKEQLKELGLSDQDLKAAAKKALNTEAATARQLVSELIGE